MKLISSLLLSMLYILISCTDVDNPLYGEWAFVKGNSNGKITFASEKNRKKVFKKNMKFYVSKNDKNGKHITFSGNYEIIDKDHFKENLGNGVYAIYEFQIQNDTLRFEGRLNIPLDNKEGHRNVFVKETWVKK